MKPTLNEQLGAMAVLWESEARYWKEVAHSNSIANMKGVDSSTETQYQSWLETGRKIVVEGW